MRFDQAYCWCVVQKLTGAGLSIFIMVGLAACVSPHVVIPNGDLPACVDRSAIELESIVADRPECDLAGRDLIFPDGFVYVAPPVGSNGEMSGTNRDFYTVANLGEYGIVAAQTDRARSRTVWFGNGKAIDTYQASFGDNFPNK